MVISGTAYTQPRASSASELGRSPSPVISAPVQSTLRQVATNKSAGVTRARRSPVRSTRASGSFAGMGLEQLLQLRRKPFELPPQICLDHSQLRFHAQLSTAEPGVFLDADAVEQAAEPDQPALQ